MASRSENVAPNEVPEAGNLSSNAFSEKPQQSDMAQEQEEYLDQQDPEKAARPSNMFKIGRIVGGVHAKELQDDDSVADARRPLEEVDFDLPLTYTKNYSEDGKDYIVLSFAPGDPENPHNWSPKRKGFIVAQLVGMTLFIGLATTAYSSGINSMVADLGVSNILGQLGLFTFNFTCALAPMFLAPFCELVGRKIVYVGAYACFILMFIGLALGKNIATILVCRALLGLFGCVGTILVGGKKPAAASSSRSAPRCSAKRPATTATAPTKSCKPRPSATCCTRRPSKPSRCWPRSPSSSPLASGSPSPGSSPSSSCPSSPSPSASCAAGPLASPACPTSAYASASPSATPPTSSKSANTSPSARTAAAPSCPRTACTAPCGAPPGCPSGCSSTPSRSTASCRGSRPRWPSRPSPSASSSSSRAATPSPPTATARTRRRRLPGRA
ncbi:hypothetical protein FH972_023202 [Carpinus fangiana]|uniref:Major facilitator superfamily (MFS) profile domain-containing protein n=1 Tax=Carpinus fangiana TaxID=176857 RepID=A0A5N6KUH8_9ROSI|nr:hypothetical protein FH972_023202 [Carpinus fangiana]